MNIMIIFDELAPVGINHLVEGYLVGSVDEIGYSQLQVILSSLTTPQSWSITLDI